MSSVARQAERLLLELDAVMADYEKTGRLDHFGGDLHAAKARLRTTSLGGSMDFVMREFMVGGPSGTRAMVAYLEGAVDLSLLNGVVLKNLLYEKLAGTRDAVRQIRRALLPVAHVKGQKDWAEILSSLTDANPVLFVEDLDHAFALDIPKWPARAIPNATSELSVKGPQDAFTEPLKTNLALLRRYVRSDSLRAERLTIGTRTHTDIAVCYLEGVANPSLVENVKRRIAAIKIGDGVTIAKVQVYLRDHPGTPFPLTRTSPRPDEACRALALGKVVVISDNDPFVLLLPTTITDFYSTQQDYQFNFWEASYTRVIRMIAWFIGLYLPALYIAVASVNPDLLPPRFALVLAGSRESLPFPPILEVLIMFVIIEVVREASLRLPQPMGTTLGTVGAIVLGTAIVQAGIVSAQMIIVVTLTALSVFTTPDFAMTAPWRLLMWVFVLGAYVFGVYGIMLATFLLLGMLARLTSTGYPYFSPLGPIVPRDLRDSLIRTSLPALRRRPVKAHALNVREKGRYGLRGEEPALDVSQEIGRGDE